MRSLGNRPGGGNFNLRGKRTKMCSCRCCMMINPKYDIKKKEDQRVMRNAMRGV